MGADGNYSTGVVTGIRRVPSVVLPSQAPMFVDAFGTPNPISEDPTRCQSLQFNAMSSSNTSIGARKLTGSVGSYGIYGVNTIEGLPCANRHMDGANYSFVDGHVKWMHFIPYSIDASVVAAPNNTNYPSPPRQDLDYDGDGIVGTASQYR